MRYTEKLIARILFLEGEPIISKLSPIIIDGHVLNKR